MSETSLSSVSEQTGEDGPAASPSSRERLRRGAFLVLGGSFWLFLSFALAVGLRLIEWPSWDNPEFRFGNEWLLATHDAYHWVAGAEGFSFGAGHPMSEMLRLMADAVGTYPAAVAFWFPVVLAGFVGAIVCAWVWSLASLEAGVAAGLVTCLAPGFLGRTLLGFYDTDLVTLFFPLFMTLALSCWIMRYMVYPGKALRRFAGSMPLVGGLFGGPFPAPHLGNPLRWQWVLALGVSGAISWWTQEWHSVFPYLIRYNVALVFALAILLSPPGRRHLLLVGGLAYALPALCGPWGLVFSAAVIASVARSMRLRRFFTDWRVVTLLWIAVAYLMVRGEILQTIVNHVNAYLKHAGDAKATGAVSLVYPSVAQSIIEVQDLSLGAVLAYFHPWREASILGILGFFYVAWRRPAALLLLPLATLGLLSTRLGGRMVMFGAPIVAIGLAVPLYWMARRFLPRWLEKGAGVVSSLVVSATLVVPFVDIIPAMSQGPMINRRHAEALATLARVTPPDAMVWVWWDWGYAAHHFAHRNTIADGAQHGGPSLYVPAAVYATDNARFARQLIRYTASKGNEPGNVFEGLDGAQAEALMEDLRRPSTALVKARGRQFLVVSYEMLRLGFWIGNFGGWNFATQKGEGGALSIVPQALAYRLEEGLVQLENEETTIAPASISVFDETGVVCRDYVREWFEAHPKATEEEKQEFLATRRNVHFFFNRVTGEKLAMDARLYSSIMSQLLICDPHDPRFTPYFRLVYDNVFARIYEVL